MIDSPLILADELIRKCIHFTLCIAVLILFEYGSLLIIIVTTCGISFYTLIEWVLQKRVSLPLIGRLMYMVSRRQRTVPLGPYTFAIGIVSTIMLFPPHVARMAILSLAFGDAIASLIGISQGHHTLPFGYKTWEGSTACFIAILLPLTVYTNSSIISIYCALVGTLCESIPIQDGDNILIPLGTGSFLSLLYLWG